MSLNFFSASFIIPMKFSVQSKKQKKNKTKRNSFIICRFEWAMHYTNHYNSRNEKHLPLCTFFTLLFSRFVCCFSTKEKLLIVENYDCSSYYFMICFFSSQWMYPRTHARFLYLWLLPQSIFSYFCHFCFMLRSLVYSFVQIYNV